MLIILTTHPIQYQVPLWQALARDGRVPFEVWFLCDHAVRATHDPEFGRSFSWDLGHGSLEGYPHRFLSINKNWSLQPSDFFGIRLRKSVVPLLREKGATELWIQGWQKFAYWQAVAQAKRAGVKVWLRGETNDLAPEGRGIKRWVRNARLRWLFSRVDRFLCIGTANRRFYRKHGVRDSRLMSAPYCVDNARFAANAEALRPRRAELRKAWGIADDTFCVLFCGKFIAKKRPLDLIAAFARLPAATKAHLLFVGSGELGGELRARCDVVFDADAPATVSVSQLSTHNSQPPRASFPGFLNQTEISRAYIAADVLVLPSDHGETWGLVVNEAMASGLPCVVSDAVGCGEDLVMPIDPTLRFALADVQQLALAIDRVRSGKVNASHVTAQIAGFDFSATVAAVARLVKEASPTPVAASAGGPAESRRVK